MMGNSPTKHTMQFQAMSMQDLRVLLENDLSSQGYISNLTNMTESDLVLKVIKNSQKPTIVSLKRQRHRPLEVELTVDHTLLDSYDLITKKAKEKSPNNGTGSFMMYRWLWIGLILFGFLISIFLLFINVIVSLIETATPGWTDQQRGVGILIVSLIILLWYVYVRPRMQIYEGRKRFETDKQLLENITAFINSMAYQAPTNAIVRCWNCFEKIDSSENFCLHCGKEQN